MSRRLPRGVAPLLTMLLLIPAAGCSSIGVAGQRVTVFAASSLTEAFRTVRADFERRHPDTDVVLSFGSSATLARQLRQGAPADVFAAADRRTMGMVTNVGLAPKDPPTFARNQLQIAVPAGNPGRVRGLPDLARAELAVALCAPTVPCGAAAQDALRAADLKVLPDSYEKDVKAAMAKVVLGEVDAALVYRTDVLAAGDKVVGIELPAVARVVNDYPVAILDAAANPRAARAFVAHLRSPVGQRALSEAGFEIP